MNKVYQNVISLAKKYEQLWWDMPSDMPMLKEYSNEEKAHKQAKFNKIINVFDEQLQNHPSDKAKTSLWLKEFKNKVLKYAAGNLGFDNKDDEKDMLKGYTSCTEKFITKSQKFDNELTSNEIYQAIRNVWIMNLLQFMLNKDIECTNSVLSYSLLYPYTDNFLDNKNISANKKRKFVKRLEKRLNGAKIHSKNDYEGKVYSLVELIEAQYSHNKCPQVYESILSIHLAQCKSYQKQNLKSSPYESNILYLSFEKGGASVVTDAYLASCNIDKKIIEFAFSFGAVLQLIDDLQDIKSDQKENNQTIFSQSITNYKLDKLTNKLINFIFKCINYDCLDNNERKDDIKKLITGNLMKIVVFSVFNNRQYYSKEYIKEIEKYSPISMKYHKANQKKIKKIRKKMLNIDI